MLQFYRVEVKVLPPEADAAPRTRSVLRRFNHFTNLHQRVNNMLPYIAHHSAYACTGVI